MNSVKYFYLTSVFVLCIFGLFNVVRAARYQDAAKAPKVRIHPVTRAEYDALIRLTKDPKQLSEGRLITSGLSAIRDLAVGLRNGIFPNLFANLLNRNNVVASDKVSNKISDDESEEEEDPLCVIATDEATVDDELAERMSKRDDGPIVNCVVIVKNREGEDANHHLSHKNVPRNPSSNVPWYPNPDPYANFMPPYMSWFNAGDASTQSTGLYPPLAYYPMYPFAYPPANSIPTPKKKHNSRLEAKRTRLSRSFKMLPSPPSPQQLSHKFVTVAAEHVEQQKEKDEEQEDDLHHSDSSELDVTNDVPEAIHSNELSNVAYQPVQYPQFGYPSNYPKVAYAHALPYLAPVYVPSPTVSVTKKPTTLQ